MMPVSTSRNTPDKNKDILSDSGAWDEGKIKKIVSERLTPDSQAAASGRSSADEKACDIVNEEKKVDLHDVCKRLEQIQKSSFKKVSNENVIFRPIVFPAAEQKTRKHYDKGCWEESSK